MKEVEYSVTITATKEKVWDVLWQDETFRQWANLIDPGTYMVGEITEGNEVQFISAENGYGVTSLVAKVIPGEYLLLKHRADTQDTGERERADEWTGGEEKYVLSQTGDTINLTVTFDVPLKMEDYFNENYPKALEKVKQLSEEQ